MRVEKRIEYLEAPASDSFSLDLTDVAGAHKILIVEDHPAVCKMLSLLFESEGYKTVCAGDGQEGFDLAVRENPDLVLTDLDMPRVNGAQLIGLLRQVPRHHSTPVVVLTACVDGKVTQALDRGANAILQKPVSLDKLCETVRQLLPVQ